MSAFEYRPITDTWFLARSKVRYYGAFPAGFLQRARDLLGVGIEDAVLHVCSGMVKEYPYSGFGYNDKTLDIDPSLNPDFCQDARQPLPLNDGRPWNAVLIDRPYTPEDAKHYASGPDVLPPLNQLLKDCLKVVKEGGKVGVLDYITPHPPKNTRFVADIKVTTGFNNRPRNYSVFARETMLSMSPARLR